jgi:hypothetical protein
MEWGEIAAQRIQGLPKKRRVKFEGSRTYKSEPQNNEQGITNVEGNFIIRNSLFDIRYSFLISLNF